MSDPLEELGASIAAAWRPPERLRPSEWAERYRVLGDRVTSVPGPYRGSRTPFAAGVLDALAGGYLEVYLEAAAQVCKSEIGRNWLGWSVDQDPGPFLIVFPTEKAAGDTLERAVRPMFEDSPRLAAHMTGRAWDVTTEKIELDTCTVAIAWAGGKTTTAAQPSRRVLLDEINKYGEYRGGPEGSTIAKARKRVQSYAERGTIYAVSTPTTLTGAITVAVNACVDRRDWQVPCPGCGAFAALSWDHVEWAGKESTHDEELLEQLAALEADVLEVVHVCPSCSHRLTDDQRWAAVSAGEWVSEGFPRGQRPVSRTVGFHLSGLCSPWTGFAQLAHRFISAKLKGLGDLVAFYNEDLGVPFGAAAQGRDERLTEVPPKVVHRKAQLARAADFRRGLVPAWATHLVAGADPGKVQVPYGVRALGPGYRSALVAAGVAPNLEALDELVLLRTWDHEGGDPMRVRLMPIDVGGSRTEAGGGRTDEIYRWAAKRRAVVRPTKGFGGAGTPTRPLVTASHQYRPLGQSAQAYDVTLTTQDTEYFKDLTAARILDDDDALWQIACFVPTDYVMQVCAEEKRNIERRIKAATGEVKEVWRWVVRIAGAANHFWDVECLMSVAAYMLNMDRGRAPRPEVPIAPATAPQERPRREAREDRLDGWLTQEAGWLE